MQRSTIVLAVCLAVAAGDVRAQNHWALAGRVGLSREFQQMDGPALGSVGGEVAALRYLGRKTAVGIEVGWYDFGTQAGAQYSTGAPNSDYYTDYYTSSSTDVALTLRVQNPANAHAAFFVTSLGISSYKSSGSSYYSGVEAAPSALTLGIGGGIGIVRLSPHLQLGFEGRLHGAMGANEGGLAAWSWASLGVSVLVH